jgi:glycine dehydrogenase subunit 1
MEFLPSSESERQEMLDALGLKDARDLYRDVPEDILINDRLEPWEGMAEQDLIDFFRRLSTGNVTGLSFLGAGCYNHYIPSAVSHITGRSEFYTSYTPYQAEASQGVLQALFEFQSMVCDLTGKEVCNATMYDGSTALAEAAIMAAHITGRKKIMVADTVHPEYRMVLETYLGCRGMTLETFNTSGEGGFSVGDDTAALLFQSPDFFGIVRGEGFRDIVGESGALLIACIIEMTSLGILRPPDADIIVCDGSGLGSYPGFGGPSFGAIASDMRYVRRMPGRIVGETVDADGNRGYALTLQAREQHIRRENAASNICTAQSLAGIAAAAHLALIGPGGLRDVAFENHLNAVYLMGRLTGIKGFELVFDRPFYNEFLIRCPDDTYGRILDAGIIPGFMTECYYPELGNCMILNCTEQHTQGDMDSLAEAVS